MINLSEYVPILEEEHSLERENNVTILGIRFIKENHYLMPNMNTFLVPKETYDKLVGFLKPIEGQLEWQTLESNVTQLIMNEPHKIDNRKIHLLHEHVRKQWEDRLSHSGGSIWFQYNCSMDFSDKNWVRKIAVHNDTYGVSQDSDQTQLKKISYAKYIVLHFTSLLICGVNNFFNRRIIAIEQKIQLKRKLKKLKEFREKFYAKPRRNS